MAASKGKDLAERTPAQLATIQRVNEMLESVFPIAGGDGFSMIEDILNADLADLIGESDGGTVPVEELFGHLLRIDTTPKLARSDYEDAPGTITPWYVVLEGTDLDTGNQFVTTTSGLTVQLKLAKVAERHAFPCVIKLSESRTNNGYDVQNCSILNVTESQTVDA